MQESQRLNKTNFPSDCDAPVSNFIAHIGIGGFARSHFAFILNQLLLNKQDDDGSVCEMANGSPTRWGIIGVGLMPGDRQICDVLRAQDFLYCCHSVSESVSSVEIIRSIVDFVHIPSLDPSVAVCESDIRKCFSAKIISVTGTEKCYCRGNDGNVDITHALVAQDIAGWATHAASENEHFSSNNDVGGLDFGIRKPKTVMGFICTVLEYHRIHRSDKLPTILSLDNLPLNGDITQIVVLEFAKHVSTELHDFLVDGVAREIVCFPNSMVDRITPVTTKENIEKVEREFGIADGWPVVCEPFLQWAVEDKFSWGRPPFENVKGVIFTDHVEPYEFMKLRLLNSSHSVLAYAALLLKYTYVHEAVQDPLIRSFLKMYMNAMKMTLQKVRGVNFDEYIEILLERFANPAIGDTLRRLATDGSQKFLSTLAPALATTEMNDRDVEVIACSLAIYVRYCAGDFSDPELDNSIQVEDPLAVQLAIFAKKTLAAHRKYQTIHNKTTCNVDVDDLNTPMREFLKLVIGDVAVERVGFISSVGVAFAALVSPVGEKVNIVKVLEHFR